jgi:hypothetical protein
MPKLKFLKNKIRDKILRNFKFQIQILRKNGDKEMQFIVKFMESISSICVSILYFG